MENNVITYDVDKYGYVNVRSTMTIEEINAECERLDREWEQRMKEMETQN